MNEIKKIKCPKCRKILLRYKDELNSMDGKLELHLTCPDCGTYVISEFSNKDNYKKKLTKREAEEILNKFNSENGGEK